MWSLYLLSECHDDIAKVRERLVDALCLSEAGTLRSRLLQAFWPSEVDQIQRPYQVQKQYIMLDKYIESFFFFFSRYQNKPWPKNYSTYFVKGKRHHWSTQTFTSISGLCVFPGEFELEDGVRAGWPLIHVGAGNCSLLLGHFQQLLYLDFTSYRNHLQYKAVML